MLTDLAVRFVIPFAQFTAVHAPVSDISTREIRLEEPEHGHSEHDTSMLEHTLLDVHSPIITGGLVEFQQSFVLLEAANRGIHKWWATTPLGKPFVFGDVLRACARARHSSKMQTTLADCTDTDAVLPFDFPSIIMEARIRHSFNITAVIRRGYAHRGVLSAMGITATDLLLKLIAHGTGL